jgi:hypothetical protein
MRCLGRIYKDNKKNTSDMNNYDEKLNELVAEFSPDNDKTDWKDYEVQTIRSNYRTMSDKEICEQLLPHRSHLAVRFKRGDIGCSKRLRKNQMWTPEEIEILKKVWRNYNQRQISEKFIPTKTPIQINQRKMHMGLKKPPVWTNEERGLLIDYGANHSHRELQSKFFQNKSLSQINSMRKHLGIRRNEK